MTDWPTRDFDMKLAATIIRKHIELNGGEPLVLIEELLSPVKDSEYRIPEWISDLTDCFMTRYGFNKGKEIANRVLTRCFLAGQTIH